MHQAEITLDGVPSSVAVARRAVADLLETAGAFDQVWAALQAVSELATNAVVHARTAFAVGIYVDDVYVRITVTDERPSALATKRSFSAEATTGRGLRLVEALSREWGVDSTGSTKTVWCKIERMPADDAYEVDDYESETAFADRA